MLARANVPEHIATREFSTSNPETAQDAGLKEGWAWMRRGRRWHLFRGGISACGKHRYRTSLGPLRQRPLLWRQKKTAPCRFCWMASSLDEELRQ